MFEWPPTSNWNLKLDAIFWDPLLGLNNPGCHHVRSSTDPNLLFSQSDSICRCTSVMRVSIPGASLVFAGANWNWPGLVCPVLISPSGPEGSQVSGLGGTRMEWQQRCVLGGGGAFRLVHIVRSERDPLQNCTCEPVRRLPPLTDCRTSRGSLWRDVKGRLCWYSCESWHRGKDSLLSPLCRSAVLSKTNENIRIIVTVNICGNPLTLSILLPGSTIN